MTPPRTGCVRLRRPELLLLPAPPCPDPPAGWFGLVWFGLVWFGWVGVAPSLTGRSLRGAPCHLTNLQTERNPAPGDKEAVNPVRCQL
jgi:hypothetical protein